MSDRSMPLSVSSSEAPGRAIRTNDTARIPVTAARRMTPPVWTRRSLYGKSPSPRGGRGATTPGRTVSLSAQGANGIDPRRPQRGDDTGDARGQREENGRGNERPGVVGLDAVEQARDQARERQRGGDSDREPDDDRLERLSQYEPQNAAAPGAQRESHADLGRSFNDSEGGHGVDPGQGED